MEMRWQFFVEIWLIALAVLYVYRLIKGTRGANVLSGFIIVLAFLLVISSVFQLKAIILLLQALSAFLVISLVIIFQPELRQIFAELGRADFFAKNTRQSFIIENVVQAIESLKEHCYGALIAFERSIANPQVLESGVPIRAAVTEELLTTIFTNKTPLHDGGVVIVDDRVQAAGCIFPLTQKQNINRTLGLRHRAALGLSEESDVIVVVLSEETGEISVCQNGEIERSLTIGELRLRLSESLMPKVSPDGKKVLGFSFRKFRAFFRLKKSRTPKFSFWSLLEIFSCVVIAVLIWILLMQGIHGGPAVFIWPF